MAVGKLVADEVLELSAPLVTGGQQRVVRTTTAGGAPANVTANLARLSVPAEADKSWGWWGDLPGWAPELMLVHAGARSTRVLTRAGAWEVPVDPLLTGRRRDTTGCGDAFVTGVLAG